MGFLHLLLTFCLCSGLRTAIGSETEAQLACNYSTVWVDLVFVVDASAVMGESTLQEAWLHVSPSLAQFTIEYTNYTTSNYISRLGIVTYGHNATVFQSLGSVDNEDIAAIKSLPYNGENETNLENGIRTAVGEFNGPNHRPNARSVIVILAASFQAAGQTSPERVAATFKESGGIIIVYHVAKLEAHVQMLKDIASLGYYLKADILLGTEPHQLSAAICDANIFCPHNSHSFLNNERGSPIAGCYTVIGSPQSFIRASRHCSVFYSGMVTSDETANKTEFLHGLIPKTSFYIGLQWNNTTWVWMDENPLGSYQPWENDRVPVGSASTCVILTPTKNWTVTDCRNGFCFCCENPVCNYENYCQ